MNNARLCTALVVAALIGIGPAEAQPQGQSQERLIVPGDFQREALRSLENKPRIAQADGVREPVFDVSRLGVATIVDMEAWSRRAIALRELERNRMVVGPRVAAEEARRDLVRAERACQRDPAHCATAAGLRGVVAAFQAAASTAPACNDAAITYLSHPQGAPADAVAAYDRACLASTFVRGPATLPPLAADARPVVFTSGGRNPSGEGALRAIGLIEMGDVPICGALLRNDRTIVTARHCIEDGRAAWQANALFVRAADGRGRWKVGAMVSQGTEASPAVRDDWVVLRLETAEPIGAPETVLAPLPMAGEVTLLGHFREHLATGYRDAASEENWRLGQRWPRENLCQATFADTACLHMFCQTVRGFSGTPIFLTASDPSRPLQVVGFVSRPSTASEGSGCGAIRGGVTLAVPAGAIQ